MEVSGQIHAPATLLGKRAPTPRIRWIGGCVGPGAGLDAAAVKRSKFPSLPGIEARSSSPYPGHYTDWQYVTFGVKLEITTWRPRE